VGGWKGVNIPVWDGQYCGLAVQYFGSVIDDVRVIPEVENDRAKVSQRQHDHGGRSIMKPTGLLSEKKSQRAITREWGLTVHIMMRDLHHKEVFITRRSCQTVSSTMRSLSSFAAAATDTNTSVCAPIPEPQGGTVDRGTPELGILIPIMLRILASIAAIAMIDHRPGPDLPTGQSGWRSGNPRPGERRMARRPRPRRG